MERAEHVDDVHHPALIVMDKGNHAQFDDLVPGVIEAGRFHIHDDRKAFTLDERTTSSDLSGPQPPEHPVVIMGIKNPSRLFVGNN